LFFIHEIFISLIDLYCKLVRKVLRIYFVATQIVKFNVQVSTVRKINYKLLASGLNLKHD
ncbi:MAG: hypothetical protein KAI99_05875, partial [Cyclobacteriaceae bacterium]|nr:hypothetical protein [Cyclobacteriaceae bacterium]